MNKTHYAISLLFLAVAALGAYTVTRPTPTATTRLGALSSPDIASPFISWGGVRHWAQSAGFYSASSTLCAIQSPAATSTLTSADLRVDSLPYTLLGLEISKASTAFASTTQLAYDISFSTSELGYLRVLLGGATSSPTGIADSIIAPNQFINFRFATTTTVNSNFAPTGKCQASFREL
jgi:hypothetical protein